MRLLSYLYFLFQKQDHRESMDFFWKAYHETRKGGTKGNFYGCILHRLYRENMANIALEADIEEVPTFPHGIAGVFISRGARIGKGCIIFQQVTIGSNTTEGSKGYGAPSIGNNVFIGVGAKIIGKVHVGDNARIGAGCVVTEDVPTNSTVVMNKPRIIQHDGGRSNKYEEYQNGRA